MTETTTATRPPEEVNWAHGYMPDPSCEPHDVGKPVIADGTVQQGSNGVKSMIHDLPVYYKAVLDTYKLEIEEEEEGSNTQSSQDTSRPLRNVKTLFTPHISLDPDAVPEAGGQWYGAGWAIAELPEPLGRIGTNGMFIDPTPLVGKCANKMKIWYHNGSLERCFSSVHILPESGTIITVLANSNTKNDAADWVGQLLVEHFLDCCQGHERNDYLDLARKSADAYDEMWKKLPGDLEKAKPRPASNSHPLRVRRALF